MTKIKALFNGIQVTITRTITPDGPEFSNLPALPAGFYWSRGIRQNGMEVFTSMPRVGFMA